MKYIIEQIIERIEKLKSTPINGTEELEFFKKNIKINKSNLISMKNVNKSWFLLACMRVERNCYSFEEEKKVIEYLKEDIDNCDYDSLGCVINAIFDLDNENLIDEIYSYKPNIDKINNLNSKDSYEIATTGLKKIFNNPNKYRKFVDLFKKYKGTPVFDLLLNFNTCLNILDIGDVKYYLSKNGKKGKMFNDVFVEKVDILKNILNIFDNIEQYTNSLQQKTKKSKNIINKQYNSYENLLIKLKNSNIELKSDNIDFIDDETFKQDIIFAVLSENNEKYQELLTDYNKNKDNDINELDKLLSNYGVVISDDSNKLLLLENVNIENIENNFKAINPSILEFLKSNEDTLVKIVLLSDSSIISNISNLYNNNVFTLEFIKNNIGIFISNNKNFTEKEKEVLTYSEIEPLYDKLNKNIELLSQNNVCLSNIKKYDINFLLKNTDDLIDNINIINTYNINLDDPYLIDFSIIDNIKQLDVVDAFIEQGMFEYLKSHIELINSDINVIKKIVLSNDLNIPIFDDNNVFISEIVEKNRFYILDSKLDEYIDNASLSHLDPDCYITLSENKNNLISNEILYNPLVLNLENNNKISNNEYSIGGIIISRNKVLRNMTTLKNKLNKEDVFDKELLVNSVLYNTILSEESIQVILDTIDTIDKSKSLKKN